MKVLVFLYILNDNDINDNDVDSSNLDDIDHNGDHHHHHHQ